jgi:hypothetical protein
MPRRSQRWIWGGRAVFGAVVAGLAVYLTVVGLDEADKIASGIGVIVALLALGAPYLLPPPQTGGASMPDPDRVEDSGAAKATRGGQANTGADVTGDSGPAQVTRSGDATADGSGSVANTGVQRRRGP